MEQKRSALVIGSGAAGSAAARTLAARGWRVRVAERGRVGGICLWKGCIPKKSLYHSASLVRAMRDADRFGVEARDIGFDWQGVLAWKWHAQESYAGDQEASLRDRGIELVKGDAAFLSEDSVAIGDTVVTADAIVVATGSRPLGFDIPGAELADTSDDALRYPAPPASLLIVGGGFIAAEMAGIYASFGTAVTLVTRAPRLLDMLDSELADYAAAALDGLGVRIVTGATLTSIEGEVGALSAVVRGDDGAHVAFDAERVLQAIGRVPAIEGLHLDSAGIETDQKGHLVIDQYLRTTNPRVWAAGDVAGGMMQTPVANLEGRTVAASIDEGVPQHPDCASMPITCFTVPQLASVGFTEKTARDAGRDVVVKRTGLGDIGAGVVAGETHGFYKLVCERDTGRILGAQCAAHNASDLIYGAAVAIQAGLTSRDIGRTVAVHPSFAEVFYYDGD